MRHSVGVVDQRLTKIPVGLYYSRQRGATADRDPWQRLAGLRWL